MISKKEIFWMILFSILIGILIKIRADVVDPSGILDVSKLTIELLLGILTFFIILSINIIAKKLTARYLDSSIEIKPWSFKQFWFRSRAHFRRAFPSGIVFPIFTTFFTMGYFTWLGILTFEPTPLTSRVTKRHGLYRYSELTEYHIALIAAAGVILNLLFAMIFYFTNLTFLAKFSIYFAAWSLVPLGSLDGSKIFFGSRILWTTLALIALVFLSSIFFIP